MNMIDNLQKDIGSLPRLPSFIYWRFKLGNIFAENPTENGVCKYCSGWRSYINEDKDTVRCLCDIQEETKTLYNLHKNIQSPYKKRKIEELEAWGNPRSQKIINSAIDTVIGWIDKPDKWMLIYGAVGTGKTHILSSIAYALSPWALYILTSDFLDLIFKSLNNSSEELSEVINTIKYAPILLLDDLGTEHQNDFIQSKLRGVFTFRYERPEEFVTVVTTNKQRVELRVFDSRIADRLLDSNNIQVSMEGVSSYRSMKT